MTFLPDGAHHQCRRVKLITFLLAVRSSTSLNQSYLYENPASDISPTLYATKVLCLCPLFTTNYGSSVCQS